LEFDDGRKKKYRTLPQRPVKVTNPAVRYLESRGISRAKEDLCASSAIRVKPGGKGAPWVVEKTEFSEPDTYTPPSDI
ncbi:hypothetical protein ACTQ0G_13340, partial [Oscillospiraceae bacterium LCP21S3_A1]